MKKIFILVGPSGSGKTTLGRYLESLGIPELISHTTRKPRKGEIEGKTYYFINKKEFDKIEKIEYSEYAGNYYCLSKKEIDNKLNQYNTVFAITDIHGMRQVKKQYPEETISIFIEVTMDEMIDRMLQRGDNEDNIAKRMSNAVLNNELENGKYCDYIVRNDKLYKSQLALNKIIKQEKFVEQQKIS